MYFGVCVAVATWDFFTASQVDCDVKFISRLRSLKGEGQVILKANCPPLLLSVGCD